MKGYMVLNIIEDGGFGDPLGLTFNIGKRYTYVNGENRFKIYKTLDDAKNAKHCKPLESEMLAILEVEYEYNENLSTIYGFMVSNEITIIRKVEEIPNMVKIIDAVIIKGKVVSVTYNNGDTISYIKDGKNMIKVTNTIFGDVIKLSIDDKGKIAEHWVNDSVNYKYKYDKNDNITEVTVTPSNNKCKIFEYDKRGRLLSYTENNVLLEIH